MGNQFRPVYTPFQYVITNIENRSTMSKVAKKQFRTAQNKAKKIMKKQSKPRALSKLQKSKPKRYMNPYLCFLQEQRKLFKGGKLLSDWRLAHKGLGAKWRALEQERQGIRGKERCIICNVCQE